MPAEPEPVAPPQEQEVHLEQEITLPPYHVVLLDDNMHTYEYVIGMLKKLFDHDHSTALQMAREVDAVGCVNVETTNKERADLKKSQIESYGPDPRLDRSNGSMSALVEPAK